MTKKEAEEDKKLGVVFSTKGTNFSPWFNPLTKYGMPIVHMNMSLNN